MDRGNPRYSSSVCESDKLEMRRTNANRNQILGCQCFRQQTHIVRAMITAGRAAVSVCGEDRDVKYVVSNTCTRHGINLPPRQTESDIFPEAVTATSHLNTGS